MAFTEYRNPFKKSTADEFDIERFAYDVFAYMLRIFGFPESKIPTTSLKENTYIEADFVKNVGLSALPIALYIREDCRLMFSLLDKEIQNFQSAKTEVELMLTCSEEFEEEDTLSKIQFSLAFLIEFTLYLDFVGVEDYFDLIPRVWSGLCKEIVAESEDSDQTLESLLTMYPDISESWITRFIRKFATPYGSSKDVSEDFSLYALECNTEADGLSSEASSENTAASNESVPQLYRISDRYPVTRLPENSNTGLNYMLRGFDLPGSSGLLQISEEVSAVGTIAYGRNTNGLNYVKRQCLKKRKRSSPREVEVEDYFVKMHLENGDVSPENRDTKRPRTISGKDQLQRNILHYVG